MESNPFLRLVPLLLVGVPLAMLVSADWSSIFSDAAGRPAAAIPGPAGLDSSTIAGLTATGNDQSSTSSGQDSSLGDWPLNIGDSQPGQPADRPTLQDLSEVLRFDVTAAWILGRWPWVSAGLAELNLQGYRVPVVTGAAENDLAGALTYYFDSRQRIQRITFSGTTGDPDKLVRLLVARFHFGRHLTHDPGLFRYEVPEPGGSPKSYADIRLVRPSEPKERFDVSFVIARPQE